MESILIDQVSSHLDKDGTIKYDEWKYAHTFDRIAHLMHMNWLVNGENTDSN